MQSDHLKCLVCARFNRYMVECECGSNSTILLTAVSFNRYMVECE